MFSNGSTHPARQKFHDASNSPADRARLLARHTPALMAACTLRGTDGCCLSRVFARGCSAVAMAVSGTFSHDVNLARLVAAHLHLSCRDRLTSDCYGPVNVTGVRRRLCAIRRSSARPERGQERAPLPKRWRVGGASLPPCGRFLQGKKEEMPCGGVSQSACRVPAQRDRGVRVQGNRRGELP